MRIIIADDQPRVRFALRVFLERQHGIEVVGEAGNADELLRHISQSCPDGVLLAWELPGLPSSGLVSSLRHICPGLMLVALSCRDEVRPAALAAGADDFVCKADPPEFLLTAVSACLQAPRPAAGSSRERRP